VLLLVNQLGNVNVRRAPIDVVDQVVSAPVPNFNVLCCSVVPEKGALESLVGLVLVVNC
jgi:hypothetical protein